jgi:hypothetical protein
LRSGFASHSQLDRLHVLLGYHHVGKRPADPGDVQRHSVANPTGEMVHK